MGKKLFAVVLVAFIVVFSCGCSDMPFNGDIEFHNIALIIPERFIRDSTQSSDDLWVFEHGNYSEYVLVSRKDAVAEVSSSLAEYTEYMKENGAESESTTFLNNDAVVSTYYLEDVFCQEVLFVYDSSFYSVALRGGDEEGFREITDTVRLIEVSTETTG